MAVYNAALPASRVQAHFSAGSNYRSAVLADTPVAYYRLDDHTASLSGYGLWPTWTTDANGQATSYAYDALGRQSSQTLPGETNDLATDSNTYTVWCSGTSAQSPCVEVDKTQRLNSTTTATYRAFYDGLGHLVETRSPAPGGQDVVRYRFYDPSQRLIFESVPYLVTSYTGGPGASAYSIPDINQAGSSYTHDGLGRQTSATDALSNKTSTSRSVVCGPGGTGDSACYEQTLSIDPNGHQTGTVVDPLGRTTYQQLYNGNSPSSYVVYATTRNTYDYVGNLVQILHPDGSTKTTYTYDMAGLKRGMADPDRGNETYNYDQDGNLIQSIDARGSTGTIFIGYDGLNRPIWRNTTNSSTGAYDTYSYDSTAGGNVGMGRLTAETFSGAPNNSLSGSYSYTYDQRGRQIGSNLTVGTSSYSLQSTYDDAANVLTQTYPTGETVTNSYTAQGWLSGVSTRQGSTTTTLLSNAGYGGIGGGFGEMTSATLGGTNFSATYDLLDRAIDLKVKRSSDSATIFDQARTFDAAGNVSTINTTLPTGTDNQAFCYDAQNRLTWAVTSGSTPCTAAIPAGTLTAAQYTHVFTYDTMGRLTSGPMGGYSYGDAAHVHAATAVSNTYSASYDAAGNMICRTPTTAATCSGTPTGAQLSYNNEGELAAWQNQPTSPSSAAAYLYDGQGERVAQQVTQGGSTTTTIYVGDVEEVSMVGSTTQTTTYYYANGKRIALGVNGQISYLASDALGSATLAFGSSGTATASQLFAPYGGVRYSNGIMPTSFGFTGQRGDSVSGLSYFHARYLDPVLGQFTSADNRLQGGGFDILGLSRYAYVEGNPIRMTDPTGHDGCIDDGMGNCVYPDLPPDSGPSLTGDPCIDYGACDQGDPSLDSGGGDPTLGPAPEAGPSPTPVDSPPPDSPTPPDSGLDSGRTHCMCADPVERPIETIPIQEIFGAIFDPISVPAPTDERFPIELGGDGLQIMVAGPGGGGLLINVRWPGGLGILKSSGAGAGRWDLGLGRHGFGLRRRERRNLR